MKIPSLLFTAIITADDILTDPAAPMAIRDKAAALKDLLRTVADDLAAIKLPEDQK